MVGVARDHIDSTRSARLLRAVGFWVDLRPLWICAFKAVDPAVFLGGYDYPRVTVLPANEYRFVLHCIEERAEALSGSGHGNSFHIDLIGNTGQMPQWFGAPGARRNPHCAFVLWRCRALPGWTAEGGCPHMVRLRNYTEFVLHCFRVI